VIDGEHGSPTASTARPSRSGAIRRRVYLPRLSVHTNGAGGTEGSALSKVLAALCKIRDQFVLMLHPHGMQERVLASVRDLRRRRDPQRVLRLLLGDLTHRLGGEFAAAIRTISDAAFAQTGEVNTGSIGVVTAATQPLRRLTPTSWPRTSSFTPRAS
jgi:hypothetical protein